MVSLFVPLEVERKVKLKTGLPSHDLLRPYDLRSIRAEWQHGKPWPLDGDPSLPPCYELIVV